MSGKKLASTVIKTAVLLENDYRCSTYTQTDLNTLVVIILPHVRVITPKEEVNDRIF